MKDEEIKNGINELRKILMTPEEKNRIFESVLNHKNLARQPVKSPWFTSFEFFIQRNRVFSYGTIALLFVVLGSGGFVSASQKSLPGNTLYSFKVNFVEPAGSLVRLYPEEKAQYESSLATKRLVEAETLARENKLDTSKEKQINDLLTKHTLALNEAINQTEKDESREKIYSIAVNFQNEMNTHAQILDNTKARIKAQTEKRVEKKETKTKKQISEDPEEEIKEPPLSFEDPELPQEPPLAGSQTGFTVNINMAPITNSTILPNITQEEIKETTKEKQKEITKETFEEIIEKEKEESEDIEEENLISKNARANAQKIKSLLERKYNRK